ncbi:hypothetical protein [Actinopolymorpha alba]|uniref:hypothetical protein n=1 Tax=Actinopolymorpha alba TaxID=533267 RepID=UPI000374376E|nr:hypothetical protein [Actinopolymorpha alba]
MADPVPSSRAQVPTPLAALKPMLYTLLMAPVLMAVPVWFAISGWAEPALWAPVAILVLALAAFVLAESVGFAVPAIPAGTPREEAQGTAVNAWRARTMLRFAIVETVPMIGLVLSFVTLSRWPYLLALVLGLPLLAYELLPTRRTIAKLQAQLERDGGVSYLPEGLEGRRP